MQCRRFKRARKGEIPSFAGKWTDAGEAANLTKSVRFIKTCVLSHVEAKESVSTCVCVGVGRTK